MTANEIRKGHKISYKGQVREVQNARTFGRRTDIVLYGVTSRYDMVTIQTAEDDQIEVVA